MKIEFKDSIPLFVLCLSFSMALFNPIIRENDILRVGWAIIHTIIVVSYVTSLIILKAIRSFRITRIEKEVKEQVITAHYDLNNKYEATPGSGVWNRARGYVDALEWVLETIQMERE